MNKDKVITLKIGVDAYDNLKNKSNKEGLTVSKYIRKTLFPDNPIYW